jgi:DNA-binding Xre family transcriptional regulator
MNIDCKVSTEEQQNKPAQCLKDVWIERGLTATQVAGKAGISTATLYRMNAKVGPQTRPQTIARVCEILELTIRQYRALVPGEKIIG